MVDDPDISNSVWKWLNPTVWYFQIRHNFFSMQNKHAQSRLSGFLKDRPNIRKSSICGQVLWVSILLDIYHKRIFKENYYEMKLGQLKLLRYSKMEHRNILPMLCGVILTKYFQKDVSDEEVLLESLLVLLACLLNFILWGHMKSKVYIN